ncbi:MAG: hypothetical protein ACLT0Y_06175 [Christensenellales bacterium]
MGLRDENGTRLHFMKTHGVTGELVKRRRRNQRDGIDGTINHLWWKTWTRPWRRFGKGH